MPWPRFLKRTVMSCYGLITDAELFGQLLLGQGLAFPQGADGFVLYIAHGLYPHFPVPSIRQSGFGGNLRCVEFVILPDIGCRFCRNVKFYRPDCSFLYMMLNCYHREMIRSSPWTL